MLKEIPYVYAVYQEKSFSKAAKKLYITQPALSAMVKKAEQEIGTPIFDRTTSPISLTQAGNYYIEQAGKILHLRDNMVDYFNLVSSANKPMLRLGGSAFFVSCIYPSIISEFKARFKDISISIKEQVNIDMIRSVLDDTLDFFFEVDEIADDKLDSIVWGDENLILAVPANWEVNNLLADVQLTAEDIRNRTHLDPGTLAVDVSVFAKEKFVLMREGNDTFRRLIDICHKAGFTPSPSIVVDQFMTSYYLAEGGHGIALIRDTLLFYAPPSSRLFFYKIDQPYSTRHIYMYYHKNAVLTPAAKAFLEFNTCHNEVKSGC